MGDDNKDKPKIDDGEKLLEWIDNSDKFREEAEAKIEALEAKAVERDAQIDRLTEDAKKAAEGLTIIKKKDWENEDTPEGADYRFGKFLYGVRRRDTKMLATMGADLITPKDNDRDITIDKEWKMRQKTSDLGDPLTGDANTTDWQYALPAYIYAETFLRTMDVSSEIIPRLTRIPMRNRLVRWPAEGTTTFEFTFVTNEVTDKTEQKPTLTYVDLECETFAGYTGITDELQEDTFLDIGGILRIQAVEHLQATIETQALNGSGSPFTGALQNASVVTSTIDGTSFDSVTWADLRTAIQKLTTTKKRVGAVFFMHPTVWDGLISKQDGTGRYFFDPSRSGPRTAWGYPVLLSDNVPADADSAVSTAFIGFGNLKNIFHGTRMGMEIKYFDQTAYAVHSDENFYRIRTRFGDVVAIPANFVAITTASS